MVSTAVSDRIRLVEHEGHVTVRFRRTVIAETDAAIRLEERGLPPRLYIPRADARLDRLEPSERRTHCPYKGDARYFSVVAEGDVARDAVWSYEDPLLELRSIKGHLCFDTSREIDIDEDG